MHLQNIHQSTKPKVSQTANATKALQELVKEFLLQGRSKICALEYPDRELHVDSEIIPNKQISIIASKCNIIWSKASLFGISGLFVDETLAKYCMDNSYSNSIFVLTALTAKAIVIRIIRLVDEYNQQHPTRTRVNRTMDHPPRTTALLE